jgi:hypothetical protein
MLAEEPINMHIYDVRMLNASLFNSDAYYD